MFVHSLQFSESFVSTIQNWFKVWLWFAEGVYFYVLYGFLVLLTKNIKTGGKNYYVVCNCKIPDSLVFYSQSNS